MSDNLNSRLRADQICDRFENQWLKNHDLTVEEFSAAQPNKIDTRAYNELIVLEIDLKNSQGIPVVQSEYEKRFPDHRSTVELGFQRLQQLEQTCLVSINGNVESQPNFEHIAAIDIGTRIGNYQIIRCLGSGAFGVVYKAQDLQSSEYIALKFPKKQTISSIDELRQLQFEAEAARHLEHPAIVRSHGLRKSDHLLFAVQQYVDGTTLAENAPVDFEEIAAMIAQIADGLAHAHLHGITHRDLKPTNILRDREGQPLITDFGLAIHESAQRRLKGQRSGTPPYMSPEQVMGLVHQLDGRSDIWSLGVILYELLSGRRPFDGSSTDEIYDEIKSRNEKPLTMIRDDIDQELQRICSKCLTKNIRDRYPTADALANDLRSWLKYNRQWKSQSFVPLIPRGLRAFGAQDAQAYLNLLPGQRNRHGIPDSIQFWKQKLESESINEGFTIGAIPGPSGSGKSSFVKAGLLPRLDPKTIQAVYIEADAVHTEERLATTLSGIAAGVPTGTSLVQLMDGLKHEVWSRNGKKLLIVIDQFEQWLAANPRMESQELVEALRHCDGSNLFCIVLLRDEYWLAASRFFELLGVGLNESTNLQKVDLFDEHHARNVLFQIGRALGRLPENEEKLSSAQIHFLEQVIEALSNDGRVICVHLTLFAEMFKQRNWNVNELKKIGGISGVGETYLEEMFGDRAKSDFAPSEKRDARQILETLLPDSNINLRAHARIESELYAAVDRPGKEPFAKLLHWLDHDLRLITKTSPIQSSDTVPDDDRTEGQDHFYQLTHDYLVPSIRNWSNQKRRETWRGRAKIRLAELSELWGERPDWRLLPSLADFLKITFAVPAEQLSRNQVVNLRAAAKLHLLRGLGLLAIAAVVVSLLILLNSSRHSATRTAVLNFLRGPADECENNLQLIGNWPQRAVPVLREYQPEYPLRNAVALNSILEPTNANCRVIAESLDSISHLEFQFVLSELEAYPEIATPELIRQFENSDSAKERVRTAAALLYLKDTTTTKSIFQQRVDPTEATVLSHEIVHLFPQNDRLIQLIADNRQDPDLLFGLLIAASNYRFDEFAEVGQQTLKDLIEFEFVNHADPGIHELCKHLDQLWAGVDLPSIPSTQQPPKPGEKDWWNVQIHPGIELTFVRVKAGSFLRAPFGEYSQRQTELFPKADIDIERDYWISSTLLTFGHLQPWLNDENPHADQQNI